MIHIELHEGVAQCVVCGGLATTRRAIDLSDGLGKWIKVHVVGCTAPPGVSIGVCLIGWI